MLYYTRRRRADRAPIVTIMCDIENLMDCRSQTLSSPEQRYMNILTRPWRLTRRRCYCIKYWYSFILLEPSLETKEVVYKCPDISKSVGRIKEHWDRAAKARRMRRARRDSQPAGASSGFQTPVPQLFKPSYILKYSQQRIFLCIIAVQSNTRDP